MQWRREPWAARRASCAYSHHAEMPASPAVRTSLKLRHSSGESAEAAALACAGCLEVCRGKAGVGGERGVAGQQAQGRAMSAVAHQPPGSCCATSSDSSQQVGPKELPESRTHGAVTASSTRALGARRSCP